MPEQNTFEKWNPKGFARDAQYMRTIRNFTKGLIHGDILDVGCGSRVFIDLSSARSWTGLDISNRMLEHIEFSQPIENPRLERGDVMEMAFPDHMFDTVTCFFLLHHLAKTNRARSAERVRGAMREILRVLRPGGRLIVAENIRGPLEIPYHALFPLIYKVGLRLFDTEMPYFWKTSDLLAFARLEGFEEAAPYIHVPIVEPIYQPVANIRTPAFMNGNLIQKMTVFSFQKPV